MITIALILVYLLIVYLAFIVNVFQFGLYLYDNAEGEAFEGIDELRRYRLNSLFDELSAFNQFVTLFNSFAAITTTSISLIIVWTFLSNYTIFFAVGAVLSLILTLFLNVAVVQTLAKRVPNAWVIRTLKSRLLTIRILRIVFDPVARIMGFLTEKYKREQLSEEQKEDMVERAIESLAESAGLDEPLVEEDEREMIGHIIELDNTSVKELMVPRTEIVGIPATADFEEIQKIATASGHSRFPVSGNDLDDIKGIIYVKDLFGKFPLPSKSFNILDYVRKPYFVPETKISSDLLNELKKSRNHMAIVADEYGGTAGLITMEDVIELIVGDIQDEHDSEEAEIVELDDNTYRVDANVSVERLAEHVGLELEYGDLETVGGLIYDLVGSLPHVGQTVSNELFQFTVEKMEGQRIEIVRAVILKRNSH